MLIVVKKGFEPSSSDKLRDAISVTMLSLGGIHSHLHHLTIACLSKLSYYPYQGVLISTCEEDSNLIYIPILNNRAESNCIRCSDRTRTCTIVIRNCAHCYPKHLTGLNYLTYLASTYSATLHFILKFIPLYQIKHSSKHVVYKPRE